MHSQRIIVAIGATLGGLCTFLPWVTVPLLGSVYGTEINGRGWITFGLCAATLLCAFSADNTLPLSTSARTVSTVFALITAGVAVWTITEITSSPYGRAVSSIGTGLYLLIAAAGAIALLPSLINRAPKPPRATSWPQYRQPGHGAGSGPGRAH